jgi:hypothetical protein
MFLRNINVYCWVLHSTKTQKNIISSFLLCPYMLTCQWNLFIDSIPVYNIWISWHKVWPSLILVKLHAVVCCICYCHFPHKLE